jgi:DNA replication protein DnaC
MTKTNTVDAARVELLLNELRLPGIRLMWAKLAGQSDKEGWPAARFLAALAEHEMADRGRRRIERHLAEARLPAGKTLATFDFESVPMVSKAQVMALASGDAWLAKGANILLFGPSVIHTAHLPISLKFQLFLMRIARWRTSKPAGLRGLADLCALKIARSNDPRCAFAELLSR